MPAGCATTASTPAGTGAIGWVTCSASSRPRRALPTDGRGGIGVARRHPDHGPHAAAGHGAARDGLPEFRARSRAADPLDAERHRRDLALLDRIARLTVAGGDLDDDLVRIAQDVRSSSEGVLVAIWAVQGDRLTPRATAVVPGTATPRLLDLPRGFGVLGRALDAAPAAAAGGAASPGPARSRCSLGRTSASPRPCSLAPSQSLRSPSRVTTGRGASSCSSRMVSTASARLDLDLAAVLADGIGTIVSVARREEEVRHLLHRAEALRRVAGDIGSRLDLDRILSGLVDHAMVLFEGDRAAVFMRRPDGTDSAEVSRNLSPGYLNAVRAVERSLSAAAIEARRPLFAMNYRDDPRGADVRAAVVQEGYDTMCTAPLMDGTELLGIAERVPRRAPCLDARRARDPRVARDPGQRRDPDRAELPADGHLDRPAAVDPAARARLNHLTSVRDIGLAIASEMRQLIDFHNVRVYRLAGPRPRARGDAGPGRRIRR